MEAKEPKEVNVSEFTIKISDGICVWKYKMILPNTLSIAKIAENICWVLGATKDEGKYVNWHYEEEQK